MDSHATGDPEIPAIQACDFGARNNRAATSRTKNRTGKRAMSRRRAAVSTIGVVVLMLTGIAASRADDEAPPMPVLVK